MSVVMEAIFSAMDELGFTPNFRVKNIPLISESDIVQTGDVIEWPTTFDELLAKIEENEEKVKFRYLRKERDSKLRETDHYALPDFPHDSDEIRQAWLTYRQALRDLPANSPNISLDSGTGELIGVTWPTPPS